MYGCLQSFSWEDIENGNKKGHHTNLEEIFYPLPQKVNIHRATRHRRHASKEEHLKTNRFSCTNLVDTEMDQIFFNVTFDKPSF